MNDETRLATAMTALRDIRQAGYNTTEWAVWAQKMAAWGMEPDRWPKPDDDALGPAADGLPEELTPAMCDALRTGSRKDYPSDELCKVRYAALLAAMRSEMKGRRDG